MDLFFMSFETRKRIKTRLGLFFTSLEMRERVGVRVDLFFMSLETRKRIKTPVGSFFSGPGGPLFHKYLFSSHPRNYNKNWKPFENRGFSYFMV